MNMKQALAIFWSGRWIIVSVFIASVVSALVLALSLKPQYQATVQLYVNLSDAGTVSGGPVAGSAARSYVSTQVEAIRSRGTAMVAVKRENLLTDPAWLAAYRAADTDTPMEEWAASAIQSGLLVARQGASDIVAVSYRAPSAEASARWANAFADAFLRKDVEMRTAPAQELARFHDERLVALRTRFTDLETQRSLLRLEAIRRGDADATGQADPLNSMASVLATARAGVVQARAALDQARSGQNPPGENAELVVLRRQLSDVDLALRREEPQLGPTHRRIVGLRANRVQLQAQIETSLQRLRFELVAERERELFAAERRIAEATAMISQDETQRHDVSTSRASASALDREIESLRAQIDGLVQRRERALLEAASGASNVSILSRASVPASPIWPRVPLVLAIAAGVGVALGFALAFLREMLDRKIRCADDLSAYIEAPLLGDLSGVTLSRSPTKLPPLLEGRNEMPRRMLPRIIEAETTIVRV